jgi:DNA-binding FadR family transcriptional regulator
LAVSKKLLNFESSDDMMNTVIKRRSLADEVASKLQQQIVLGKYKENDQLPIEPELMRTFGVGRSTIREAIKILANAGMLRVQQGLGTFVEKPTGIRETLTQRLKRADIEDLDEVRQLLEMKIAEKAADNRTTADIKKMRRMLDLRRLAGNVDEAIDADIKFHTAIAEASKNEILADLYKTFAVQIKGAFRDSFSNTTIFKETQELHEQLLKHIESGDARKAWYAAEKIIAHH